MERGITEWEMKFEAKPANDNVLEPESRSKDSFIDFLGFHPYKEVVFLSDKFDRVLAYNWSSSKIQDLGKVFPKFYIDRDLHFHHKYGRAPWETEFRSSAGRLEYVSLQAIWRMEY